MRRLYLVTYDISDPDRLRKVFKTMRGFGEHLQLSVFQCDLTPMARVEMQAALEGVINREEDKVLIIDLGPAEARTVQSIQALGRQMGVVKRGPVIV
ncbi:MAG: CRISPR-associated endonuclease Cas2 [Candidatus Rokubacteria bacterium]|nr:CRISPR-associated endonuclease Cas2 [Candidatus Rokubacteria bacterium]